LDIDEDDVSFLFTVVCVVTAELDDEEYTITGYSSVIGKF
jgi:hypothetical protein